MQEEKSQGETSDVFASERITISEPVLTPTQVVNSAFTAYGGVDKELALQMAGDLERVQADLANEKSISSLNAKAGLELEKQLAVAQATIKELEKTIEVMCGNIRQMQAEADEINRFLT